MTDIDTDEVRRIFHDSYFDLDFPNFEKWNPRRKGSSQKRDWVNLDTSWRIDPKMRDTTPQRLFVWINLLCHRAAIGSKLVRVDEAYVRQVVRFRGIAVHEEVIKLAELGVITITEVRPKLKNKILKDSKRNQKEGEERLSPDLSDSGFETSDTSEVLQRAEGHLTPEGISLFKKRFGTEYQAQVEDAFLHWEARSKSSMNIRPFVTTLGQWYRYWKDAGGKGGVVNWEKVFSNDQ